MEIRVDSLIEGACRAEGTAIIVDVYRAFTTAAVALSRGARRIILVPEIEEALDLRDRGVGEMCIGEVGGIRPDGFDFGNSPYELSQADVRGRTLIQSTRAGTVGVASARRASRVYVGSLAIAAATARAVLKDAPQLVTIVAMGWEGRTRTDEDELCAWYIKNLLEGRRPDRQAVAALVRVGQHSQKFDDPAQPQYHPRDREIALDVDSVGLAIRVDREDGLLVASAETI
jgi:2-phosphosulfolactate phosphatase